MPLPAGFKVNGGNVTTKQAPLPPRVLKVIAMLEQLPASELLTTTEVAIRSGFSNSGSVVCHFGLRDYYELVDGKKFWGSRESIAQLRQQLAEPEESHDQD